MCGSMCPPALAKLLGWHRAKGGQRGRRPESFLTAYEMEQFPIMLNELEKANRHFWQMVCWRWSQNEQKAANERSAKKARQQQQTQLQQQETRSNEQSPKDKRRGSPDDSYVNGCALRELVRVMAKTMCEKGTFDARTETMLTDFRLRILGQRNAPMREAMGKESKVERRRREFMKLRAISFNGGLGEGVGVVAPQNGREKQQQQQEKGKTSSSTSASSSSASSGYSSGEIPKDRKAKASNWLRQRANSVRDRRAGRCLCCADNERLARLGELLNSEFHSVVFAHPTEFDVHERELKLLVWRRFTQMLVSMWADRERIDQQQSEEKQ